MSAAPSAAVVDVLDVVGHRLGVLEVARGATGTADRPTELPSRSPAAGVPCGPRNPEPPGVPDLEWGRLDAAGLRGAAAEVQAVISALEHQQRRILRLIDERRAFTATGARDAADWAAGTLGLERGKANDAVETGKRLEELPALSEAAAAGRLTADQARPAARLAELDGTDGGWASQAPALPPAALRRQLARRKRPGAADHRAARNTRHFDAWEAGQELRFQGSVPIDDGRRLLAGIERAMPPRDPHAAVPDTPAQRRADALVALAGARLADDQDPDRATVVLFAELAAVCDDDPAATAELEASQPVATETARRLLCDSRVQVVVQDPAGIAVGIGTTQRTVTPQTRRALMRRDGGCRFGNCTVTRFLHAHHLDGWPSPTTLGRLALFCWTHHHVIHEGGWTVSGDPNDALTVTHPTDGTTLTSWPRHRPPPIAPPVEARPRAYDDPATSGSGPAPPGPHPPTPDRTASAPGRPCDTGPLDDDPSGGGQAGLFDDTS